MRRTIDELTQWLIARGGIAHRDDALRAGFAISLLRTLVRSGAAELVRRAWIALPTASADLRAAAGAGARVTCVSLARRRGWWVPETTDDGIHLHLLPGSRSTAVGVRHWGVPLAPAEPRTLLATIEDALAHVAVCRAYDAALVLWESAARVEGLAPEYLRRVAWTTRAARRLADAVTGLSDSGLETLLVVPLRRWGLRVRQQVVLAGRRVDLLIGDRLVIQIDGWAHHSSSAQRASDIAHDAELRLRGYTVLRFSYAQVVHDRAAVEATIRRAVAARLHLA
ncbi:endonuclease domain-containing protein [Microbacterium sp. SORGH_AS_0888]|uniref:endonuclease domain-containing protein n=1 Tax=Microbacterium sp. SORGH_AS_0888 TaxID=3041791 RepID=UPI00278426F0|nr:DUF559 domain-containing protein [Microbacterium sp. SORGH_AS_0888]MDQ1129238.1 very-short-patch-repair endonuclease [Microbacterium sp. SORGH_AS_0888]